MSTFTIIIVSYNTEKLLHQTISSLPRHQEWHVVVVDNASTDGSVAMVKKEFPWVKVIENNQNLGFAKANNQAIKQAKSEYVVLLNSDTVVKPNAFEQILDYMDTHPEVGVVTPKVILPNGELDPACHRGMPTPWRSFSYYAGLEKVFPQSKLFGGYHQTYLDLNTVHEIETTAGTAMVIRTQAINEVGLLDEDFFLYGEDLDWCYRFTQAGWKIVYYPESVIVHYKSQSGKNVKSLDAAAKERKRKSIGYFYDTMIQFYDKHYRTSYPQWVRLVMLQGINLKKWLALRNLG